MKALSLLKVDAWTTAPDTGPSNTLKYSKIYFNTELAAKTKMGDNCAKNGSIHGAFTNKSPIFGIIPVNPSTDDKVAMKDLFKIGARGKIGRSEGMASESKRAGAASIH